MTEVKVNSEGLTLVEWVNAAGVNLNLANHNHVKAWNKGVDPTEYRNTHNQQLTEQLRQTAEHLNNKLYANRKKAP